MSANFKLVLSELGSLVTLFVTEITALIALLLIGKPSFAVIRSVYPRTNSVETINTAVGIATIIETPQAIESAIIGDSSAFEVQYLNNAVTIKPIRYGARTNLYLVTKAERYNLRLSTTRQANADYVVYIKDKSPSEKIRWQKLDRVSRSYSTELRVSEVGHSPDGYLLLYGYYYSENDKSIDDGSSGAPPTQSKLWASDIWVYQDKKPVEIDTLYLSKMTGTKRSPIYFSLSINNASLNRHEPLVLEIKGQHDVGVEVPEYFVWK